MQFHQKKVAKQYAIVGRKMPWILMHSDHMAKVHKLDALEAIAIPVKIVRINVAHIIIIDCYVSDVTTSFI